MRAPVLHAMLLASVYVTSACGPLAAPEVLVCLDTSETGGCIDRKNVTDLAVGRSYTVLVRGDGVPSRGVLELVRFEGGRPVILGAAPVALGRRTYLTNPLTLPKVGAYRLTLRDADGDVIARKDLRAPRPSVFGARNARPADAGTP